MDFQRLKAYTEKKFEKRTFWMVMPVGLYVAKVIIDLLIFAFSTVVSGGLFPKDLVWVPLIAASMNLMGFQMLGSGFLHLFSVKNELLGFILMGAYLASYVAFFVVLHKISETLRLRIGIALILLAILAIAGCDAYASTQSFF